MNDRMSEYWLLYSLILSSAHSKLIYEIVMVIAKARKTISK